MMPAASQDLCQDDLPSEYVIQRAVQAGRDSKFAAVWHVSN